MSKYRVEENIGKIPGMGKMLVQAVDTIFQKGPKTLIVEHVLVGHAIHAGECKRGFRVVTMEGPITCNCSPVVYGETDKEYQSAKRIGMLMLSENEELHPAATPAS